MSYEGDFENDADVHQMMAAALAKVEAELPNLKWESAKPHDEMTHFTGRGAWTVQLVVLVEANGSVRRMGTAFQGGLILKLTDEITKKAEALARVYFL